jgi:hypothetical protein
MFSGTGAFMIANSRWRHPIGRGLALLLMAIGAAAGSPRPALAQAGAPTCQPSSAKVTEIYRVGDASKSETLVRLGDKIAVVLDKPTEFFAEAICRKKAIVLVIDGQPSGNKLAVPSGPDAGLVFFLRPVGGLRDFWTALLGRPDFEPRPVRVGVGIEEQPPLGGDKTLRLEVLPILWLAFWLVIFVVLVFLFFKSAKSSNLLRDPMLDTEAPPGTEAAFSLSKTQGAWWFFVILACYLLIGIVTGDFTNSINSTAIILLGIGAGTVLGSAAIDASKLNERKQALAAAKARPAGDAAVQAAKDEEVKALRGESEGFLKDILSDGNGINFHRFQLAAWTVVLSIIFIKDVYVDLAMPMFSTTLMGLLGLSAGTYLGLKIPEPTKPSA